MGSLIIGPGTARRFPWRLVVQVVVAGLVLGLFAVRMFLVELVRVRGNAMAPAVLEGDLLLVRHERVVGRGDVVVVDLGGQAVLRRIMGLPGDRISAPGGVIAINELPVGTTMAGLFAYTEPLAKGVRTLRQQLLIEELMPGRFVRVLGDHIGAGRPWRLVLADATVGADQYYVLCDNRRMCPEDERQGLIPESAVVGLAQSLLWYGDARSVAPPPLQGETLPLTAGPLPPSGAPPEPGSEPPLK